jgi:hypothetical protein
MRAIFAAVRAATALDARGADQAVGGLCLGCSLLRLRRRSRPCGSEIHEEQPYAIIVLNFGKPHTLGGTFDALAGMAIHGNAPRVSEKC